MVRKTTPKAKPQNQSDLEAAVDDVIARFPITLAYLARN